MKRTKKGVAKKILNHAHILGAKFEVRRLFFSKEAKSKEQLECIAEYLEKNSTISRHGWWEALSQHERLEAIRSMTLHSLALGETRMLHLGKDVTSAYISMWGDFKGTSLYEGIPQIKTFTNGYVFGTIRLPKEMLLTRLKNLKLNNMVANSMSQYENVHITGPANYLQLKTEEIKQVVHQAAKQMMRERLLKSLGLEVLNPYVRVAEYNAGNLIVSQGKPPSRVYIVFQGECRARYDYEIKDEKARTTTPISLQISTLGRQSVFGEMAFFFNIPEPVSVYALGPVELLYIDVNSFQEYFLPYPDKLNSLKVNAKETFIFVLQRIILAMKIYGKMPQQVQDFINKCKKILKDIHGTNASNSDNESSETNEIDSIDLDKQLNISSSSGMTPKLLKTWGIQQEEMLENPIQRGCEACRINKDAHLYGGMCPGSKKYLSLAMTSIHSQIHKSIDFLPSRDPSKDRSKDPSKDPSTDDEKEQQEILKISGASQEKSSNILLGNSSSLSFEEFSLPQIGKKKKLPFLRKYTTNKYQFPADSKKEFK